MATSTENTLVYTHRGLCRVCYTCVRECPVKAIKIINGQAEVIPERCIACGNCVRVCSQGAKVYEKSIDPVKRLLESDNITIACIAPSFPAEFSEMRDPGILVSMIRKLGFDQVVEVSFGADLVAREYRKVFEHAGAAPVITSDCPAVVKYIERYHPELLENLAPIASPAMALAEVIRKRLGDHVKTVFIGPCIAKKAESEKFNAVITFGELRDMFEEKGLDIEKISPSQFDPPLSAKGAMFPVNHGLLHTLSRSEGFGNGQVITAEGRSEFIEAIKDFEQGILSNQHLELLCCDGCVQGPGMTSSGSTLAKRKRISQYVEAKMKDLDEEAWRNEMREYSSIDLSREFTPSDQRLANPLDTDIEKVLISMGRLGPHDMLNCGACGYETCRDHAIAVVDGLAETEMCLPWAIEKLHESVNELNISNIKLADTKQALKQSEKLASMGQVSAGIAHELNNPLGIISLYSSILRDEVEAGSQVYEDISMIDEQARRCQKIVGGLLNFARKNQLRLEECDIIDFIDKSLKSLVIPRNVSIEFLHDLCDPVIRIDTDQMMQVFTNLFKNAIEAMPSGGLLKVKLERRKGEIRFRILDTGTGISPENIDRIFTPFFTTKVAGKGTGLGLPLVYGIVKMHKGKINVTSNADPEKGDTGTVFTIEIPDNLGL